MPKTKLRLVSDENGANECQNHATHNANLPLVDDFKFDHQEKVALELIRHISGGLATPGYNGIQHAQNLADQEWQPPYCERILNGVIYLLGIIRITRTRTFDFIVPDCPSCSRLICQSELQVMLMLRESRFGDMDRLTTAAQLVTGSGEPEKLIEAAQSLAGLLNEFSRSKYRGNNLLH